MIKVTKWDNCYELKIHKFGKIYTGVEVCQVCGDKKKVMGFDTAWMEYYVLNICKDCLDNIWNKYKKIGFDYVK